MSYKYNFLNVGCADCTILELGSKIVMVDCHQGGDSQEDIISWLPKKHIDVLIITHQHYDHFDGIQVLLDNNVTVSELWECPYKRRHGDDSVGYDEWQSYQNLKEKLKKNGTRVYKSSRTSGVYDTVGGKDIQILNPAININDYKTRELHDASLVFAVDNLIFTGDASDYALDQVLDKYDLESFHILHASHHGSINGANIDFIKKVNPNYTIISTKSGVHSNVPHNTALHSGNYSELSIIFILSFYLGMLVRYFPTHWTALVNGYKGDIYGSILKKTQKYIEEVFPKLVSELILDILED